MKTMAIINVKYLLWLYSLYQTPKQNLLEVSFAGSGRKACILTNELLRD